MTPTAREQLRMMFGGFCAYCGRELTGKWHADHVEPVLREWEFVRDAAGHLTTTEGGFTATRSTGEFRNSKNATKKNNLFPACVPCNIDKGAVPLEEWREWLNTRIVDGLRRNSSTFRHAERFGRVTLATGPLLFWFEKYRLNEASQ